MIFKCNPSELIKLFNVFLSELPLITIETKIPNVQLIANDFTGLIDLCCCKLFCNFLIVSISLVNFYDLV